MRTFLATLLGVRRVAALQQAPHTTVPHPEPEPLSPGFYEIHTPAHTGARIYASVDIIDSDQVIVKRNGLLPVTVRRSTETFEWVTVIATADPGDADVILTTAEGLPSGFIPAADFTTRINALVRRGFTIHAGVLA